MRASLGQQLAAAADGVAGRNRLCQKPLQAQGEGLRGLQPGPLGPRLVKEKFVQVRVVLRIRLVAGRGLQQQAVARLAKAHLAAHGSAQLGDRGEGLAGQLQRAGAAAFRVVMAHDAVQ
jgi:hypothetical protein